MRSGKAGFWTGNGLLHDKFPAEHYLIANRRNMAESESGPHLTQMYVEAQTPIHTDQDNKSAMLSGWKIYGPQGRAWFMP